MGDYSIGQSVSRFEDPRLLRGGGRYVDDVVLPNMAYGSHRPHRSDRPDSQCQRLSAGTSTRRRSRWCRISAPNTSSSRRASPVTET